MNNDKFIKYLKECPIIAILRGITPDESESISEELYSLGIRIIEVPLNSPDPYTSIGLLKDKFKDKAIIGAGTVLNKSEVIKLHNIGAEIIIAPNLDIDVGIKTKEYNMIWLPGVFTPTEGFTALKYGADGLKIFPSELISPDIIKSWKSVFPKDIKIIPVGGVDSTNGSQFLLNGADGLGIGSAIFKAGDTLDMVKQKTEKILQSL
ncbi:2-dehydro-3-deoxy-6-phosphogalactonate aldolase [Gallibacterium anatis]|uniref:2-dehydro-3-deoxy-6-phosphogalactonate aldolase n=1 Tax=Gallibacterium anatis TaxID=750 RepID=UPI000530D88C|nr:2-dehydro-3-deoxy-6-phosphogalactonate aldolase [Gallibacterium anatis]KGQ63732.1 hypothetical protein IO49_10300 [Gallibacterium anatis]